MTRLCLLLLLSGIAHVVFAQPDLDAVPDSTAEKWELSAAKNLKAGMGRLNFNFPAGEEWSIDIFRGNKFIINKSIETYKLKYYDMAPGIYSFKVNTVMIENVPVVAGKTTTLNTGTLNIESADWELRSFDDKKFYTSGNKAKKLVLPVGKYRFVEGNSSRVILVHKEALKEINPGVTETDQWVAEPLPGMKTGTMKRSGRLNLLFGDSSVSKSIHGLFIFNPITHFQENIPPEGGITYIDLEPGLYRVMWKGTPVTYQAVRILENHITTLKYAFFINQTVSRWSIGTGSPSSNICGPKKIALPVGVGIAVWSLGSYAGDYIQTYPAVKNGETVSARVGYIQATNGFYIRNDGSCFTSVGNGTVPLYPAKYTVSFSGGEKTVEIKAGETYVLD